MENLITVGIEHYNSLRANEKELLEACKEAVYQLGQLKFDENDGIMYELNCAIKQAEGGE